MPDMIKDMAESDDFSKYSDKVVSETVNDLLDVMSGGLDVGVLDGTLELMEHKAISVLKNLLTDIARQAIDREMTASSEFGASIEEMQTFAASLLNYATEEPGRRLAGLEDLGSDICAEMVAVIEEWAERFEHEEGRRPDF